MKTIHILFVAACFFTSCERDIDYSNLIISNKTGHDITLELPDPFLPSSDSATMIIPIKAGELISDSERMIMSLTPVTVRYTDTGNEFEYFKSYTDEDKPSYRTPGHMGYYTSEADGMVPVYTFTKKDFEWTVKMNSEGIYSDKDFEGK